MASISLEMIPFLSPSKLSASLGNLWNPTGIFKEGVDFQMTGV
jgi:hypothetical protein